MNDTWDVIGSIIELTVLPLMGWVLFTIINHGKQIIILEEKVNDSLSRRMESIEDKVIGMETKIESKIDDLEQNVVECKIAVNANSNNLSSISTSINQKFDTLIGKIEDIR